MTKDRLIALETRLAFQEDTIATLDEVVTRQQRQIDEMSRRIAVLSERLEQRDGASEAVGSVDESPPHY